MLGLFKKWVPNDEAFKGAIIGALAAGVFDCANTLGVSAAGEVMNRLPFAEFGFSWILPAVVGFVIGWAVGGKQRTTKAD